MLVQKLKTIERYYAIERMKILPEIGDSQLDMEDNVSIFEKLFLLDFHYLQECLMVIWL
jgi:hypothetical protein